LTGFTATQQVITPQYVAFPLLASAVVPIYTLPASAGTAQLIMPTSAICAIERGNLTYWDDPRLQAANPTLTLPHLGITVFHQTFGGFPYDAFTAFCRQIDPAFAAIIARSTAPAFPTSNYYAVGAASTSTEVLTSQVMDSVGGYALATLQNVLPLGVRTALVQNAAGVVLSPSVDAISLTAIEVVGKGLPAGASSSYDLINPSSPNAWPICTTIYLWLDNTNPVSTCSTKAAVVEFVEWLYTSDSVQALAKTLNIAIMPSILLSQTSLLQKLKTQIQCQGSALVSASTSARYVQGFGGSVKSLLATYFAFYSAIDTTVNFTFSPSTNKLALERTTYGEVDLAIVHTSELSAASVQQFEQATVKSTFTLISSPSPVAALVPCSCPAW